MSNALYAAASGLYAQQTYLNTIAHNLANVNTTGFKRTQPQFQDLMYSPVLRPGANGSPTGVQVGAGTRLGGMQRVIDAGSLQFTGRDLDLAIQDDGFFRLQAADGYEVYSRDGAFRLDVDPDGRLYRLVNADGYFLLGEKGPIQLPAGSTAVSVSGDGVITYKNTVTDESEVAGQIILARFPNPSGLMSVGNNLLDVTAASGAPTLNPPGAQGGGPLAQGYLEGANVEMMTEIVNMIAAQRAYEISAKVLQTADEMAALANNLRR